MRFAMVILFILLCPTILMAQVADATLRSDLEALHAKWVKAFDGGDGATTDQMEMDKLMLVMPTGVIWTKTTARVSEQPKRDSHIERSLNEVSVRRFGDTVILTCILTSSA